MYERPTASVAKAETYIECERQRGCERERKKMSETEL